MTKASRIYSRRRRVAQKVSLERLYRARTLGGGCWSPDGRWLCFHWNAGGRQNLWVAPSEGGRSGTCPTTCWPLQLTVSDQRQVIGEWSPDGNWIAFQSDYDGNEQWDLFLVSLHTGEVQNLTETPQISEEDPHWSPNGKLLAYISKPRSSASYEIQVMDPKTRAVTRVSTDTAKEFSNSGPIWSRDGRYLAYTQTRSDQKLDILFVADMKTGRFRRVSPSEGEHNYHAADLSPDGRKLLITSNALNRYSNVALLDLSSGRIDWITREEWASKAGEFDPSGRLLTYTVNRDGNVEAVLFDLKTRKKKLMARRRGLNILGSEVFSPDGRRALFHYSGPTEPNDLYTYDFRSGKSMRVTNSLLAGMDTGDLVEPHQVDYSSLDGLKISAFLYMPYNLKRNRRNPAVVYVHGGPSAQLVNGFHRSIQYLVNNGYIVIGPNYRGSTGYGKDFEERNRFDMGGGDLQDVIHAARFLVTTGYVDPRKIALMGASYGGYMTMLGLAKAPEVWAAGVAIVPFVNWFTELENEDPILREWDLATMGDPVQNRALYEDRSPLFFIDRVRAPVLILAGANDPRCPKSESVQIVEAIRRRGAVMEYKFYEDEGHGFARVENAIDSFERTVAFLDRHMK